MLMDELEVPEALKSALISEGYKELWPPQKEAIRAGLLKGENLVVLAPTASGKTLLAILAAGKHILENDGKVVYVTPLRALASEKYQEFLVLKKAHRDINIMISTGDYDSSGERLGHADLLILTNEKFDSLIRHSASWVKQVGLFIFDEIHMIGDESRGSVLEFSITTMLNRPREFQILALSATISNSKELAEWLSAKVVKSDWRPVRLKEGVYFNGRIFFSDQSVSTLERVSGDPALDLSVDGVKEGGQVLLFADTRKRAVSIAKRVSAYIEKRIPEREKGQLLKISNNKVLTEDETSLGKALREVIRRGVAFHHAGLPYTHRKLVEGAFRAGLIRVLVATPTLAAGVNLPARRVVVLSPFRYSGFGYESIPVMEFKQMAGRAGRPKYDEEGEAILVSRDETLLGYLFERYIKGRPEPVVSKLDRRGISTYLLAYISINPGCSYADVEGFFGKTLLRRQKGLRYTMTGIIEAAKFLSKSSFIEEDGNTWYPTWLGKRVSTLYIMPETGVILKDSLEQLKTSSNIHLSALFVIVSTPDFEPKIGTRKTSEISELVSRGVTLPPLAYYSLNEWAKSFLALKAWIEEEHEASILERYGVEPGDLYRTIESAEWICYSFSEIADILGDKGVANELRVLKERLRYGIREELIEITKLEDVGRVRGRILYNAGIKRPEDLKRVDEETLAKLPKIGPKLAKKLLETVSTSEEPRAQVDERRIA